MNQRNVQLTVSIPDGTPELAQQELDEVVDAINGVAYVAGIDTVPATAGTAKDLPKLELLVIRDPDAPTDMTLFVDGEPVTVAYEHVDPGAGYQIEDWREHTATVRDNPEYSEGFKKAVVSARNEAESSPYIEGDKRPAWTFFGHWENERIVIDMHLPGVHEDTREQDDERWPEGLWCDTGHGDTVEEAEADAREGYFEAREEA